MIFIGPNDLSLSLGLPGQLQHPTVEQAFDRIIKAVAQTDKALGILVPTAEKAVEWQGRGARYVMVVMEALLGPAVRGFLQNVRSH